ncbi:MAG: hypothetical protein KDA93_02345 [Planctomycetaceae bacterium]|nr:hypothetical protein [Planctomycetaceae bacterium]
MEGLFTLSNLMTLCMLTLLQAVLGFDNLLYISIESKRVPEDKQQYVRRLGIGLAIVLRIILLFVVMGAIESFQDPWVKLHMGDEIVAEDTVEDVAHHEAHALHFAPHRLIDGEFNLHSIIVLIGGAFIIYTAVKEISHMLAIHNIEHDDKGSTRSVASAVTWIVIMNLVFSFDSILSALALTDEFFVMAAAIVVSGLMMIYLADTVAEFLKKNRMYEVLGLFILFIVGIMLLSEGGHLAHVHLFGYPVLPMTKTTFYFVLVVLVLVDIVQSRYQKKLLAQQAAERHATA